MLSMRMHLINPSATRQFLSARLEDEGASPREIETAERWLNVAVRTRHSNLSSYAGRIADGVNFTAAFVPAQHVAPFRSDYICAAQTLLRIGASSMHLFPNIDDRLCV